MIPSIKAHAAGCLAQNWRALSSFWILLVVLLCFHQLYYGWILFEARLVPYLMDGNETFSVFWHAHNLYNYSFWKTLGLTDDSLSTLAAAHPFFHTHQGNMPRLFGFVIYALGARTVPAQVLITTLIIGNATLLFCYAFFARVTTPLIAFVCCLFLFSDYLLYAQWHVVTYRVWYGFLFFGTLFAISHARSQSRLYQWPFVLLGGLFFLLFYFELVFAAYVSLTCGLCAIWWHRQQPRLIGRLYLMQIVGGSLALILLFGQLVGVFGLDVVARDFQITFLARNAGSAESHSTALQFFHDHNILFWENFRDGSSLRTIAAFIRSLTVPIFQVWTPTFSLFIVIPLLGILISNIEPTPAPKTAGGRSKNMLPKRERLPFRWLQLNLGTAWRSRRRPPYEFALPVGAYLLPAALVTTAVLFPGAVFGLPLETGTLRFRALFATADLSLIISMAGLLAGWWLRSTKTLQISRGLLTGSLVALLIANNPPFFDQSYSEIWSSQFDTFGIRLDIRMTTLAVAVTAIIIAANGAAGAFGEVWKVFICKALAFFGIGLFAYAFIYWLSPGYVMSGYAERLAPFAIFFVIVLPATAIVGLIIAGQRLIAGLAVNLRDQARPALRVSVGAIYMMLVVGVPVAVWTRTQFYYHDLFPPDYASFAKQLASPRFKNATFAVNNYAAVVAYYAGTWAYMDMAIGDPQVDSTMARRYDDSSVWFADWKLNRAYGKPSYYVCMKPHSPPFNAILAQRDPKSFGDWYQFCGKEPILAQNSLFEDRLVASDASPPRFWAIVALAQAPRPRIFDVVTSPQQGANDLEIGYDVKAATNAAYPVQSIEAELLTAESVHSCSDGDVEELHHIAVSQSGGKFRLPKSFNGLFEIRAKVKSKAGDSAWADGAPWLYEGDRNSGSLARCPEILVNSAFGAYGLNLRAAGWSIPESWGTWSDGRRASLVPIRLPQAVKNKELLVKVDVLPLIAKPEQIQIARVLANGRLVANWLFTAKNAERTATAIIPRQALTDGDSLSLAFDLPEAASPASFGVSQDTRRLGIGIKHIEIRELTLLPAESRRLSFQTDGSGPFYAFATAGWTRDNGTALRAIDQSASLLIPSPSGPLSAIVIDAEVFERTDRSRPSIEVAINGRIVGKLAYGKTSTRVALPDDIVPSNQTLFIEFKDAGQNAASSSAGSLPLKLNDLHLTSTP
jgi:hypothetical protein